MKQNMEIYDKLKIVDESAKKTIGAGRLKGFTDINPMWRIKKLTEVFGMCGIGWKYVIKEKLLEKGCKEQVSAFVDIDLFVKVNGEWSEAIPGTGGSSFIADEKNGLYQSDECFKMALTDAISIACKSLGMGADVYYEKDRTKYDATVENSTPQQPQNNNPKVEIWLTEEQFKAALNSDKTGITATLNSFDGTKGKGMKKEYKEQLLTKLKSL